jgi:hypothetical protein
MTAHYIEKMGPELGGLFDAISHDLTWIHWRWNQYRTLFGEKLIRLDLLNETAPFFFSIVGGVLFEDTLLAIARIVGPPKSLGKANLTIRRFPDRVTPELKVQVNQLIEAARKSAEFTDDWRNRHLAHRDLGLALRSADIQPLAPVPRNQVEDALSKLRDVLNCIEGKYCEAHTAYSACPAPGDAKQLLYFIQLGLLRQRDREACWDRGERHPDDVNPPEAV